MKRTMVLKVLLLLVFLSLAVSVYAQGSEEQKPIAMKFGVGDNTQSVEYAVAIKFVETAEELSSGSLKFTIFPNEQLGNAKEMLTLVSMNELDVFMEPIGGAGVIIPEVGPINMAYVVKDFDHFNRIMESDWGKDIKEKFRKEHNIRILGSTLFGTRQTSSNKPLYSIEDYKGLRMRVPDSRTLKNWAEAMGTSPTPISFKELYLALKTNSVDAQENPLPTIDSMKFYEAQSAIAIDNHVVQDLSLMFSEKRWQSLTAEQQDALMQAAAAAKKESVKLITESTNKLIQFFEDQGLEITYPDVEPMRDAMIPYYEKLEKELNVPGLIKKLSQM